MATWEELENRDQSPFGDYPAVDKGGKPSSHGDDPLLDGLAKGMATDYRLQITDYRLQITVTVHSINESVQ
jgi:hypothetical protein